MTEALGQLARYGRSFNFASRLLPASQRERVGAVYAYCRSTDDLVDEATNVSSQSLHERLNDWLAASRAAYQGELAGNDVIDRAMADMRDGGIPFRYAEELIAGMRMDVEPARYADFSELATYTYRVAGVVGLWMTAMFDVREPWLNERAVALGRAMQLTNIVRDVGDDWDRGRLYVPTSLLRSYGIADRDLDDMRHGRRPISPAYRGVMESLMTVADGDYRRAFDAIPFLPPAFRRTVAVAADVYRGIHAEVRRAGYDTLTRRAVTTFTQKCVLGVNGLRRARITAGDVTGLALPPLAARSLAFPSDQR